MKCCWKSYYTNKYYIVDKISRNTPSQTNKSHTLTHTQTQSTIIELFFSYIKRLL